MGGCCGWIGPSGVWVGVRAVRCMAFAHGFRPNSHVVAQVGKVASGSAAWLGENMRQRSVGEHAEWYASQAVGAQFNLFNDLVSIFADLPKLEQMGFALDGRISHHLVCDLEEEHPALASENAHAATVGNFILALLARETRSALWHTHCYPGRFAAFLKPDMREGVLRDMQRAKHLVNECICKWDGARWREARSRHILHDMYNFKVFCCVGSVFSAPIATISVLGRDFNAFRLFLFRGSFFYRL